MLGVDIASLACGDASSFCVTRGGDVWAWGNNEFGQLSLGHAKKVDVPDMTPWLPQNERCRQVACGAVHTLLLCNSGKVYTCGKNEGGLLGTGLRGGPAYWASPQLVEPLLSKVVSGVACGVRMYTYICMCVYIYIYTYI